MALLALAGLLACKLKTDPDQVVAIEVILPDSGRVEFTDTFQVHARGLNSVGDSVAGPVFWSSLDSLIVVLDSTTGVAVAQKVGNGLVQARVGGLRSNPQTVTILPKLTAVIAVGATRDTVFASQPDSLSDSLQVHAFASGLTVGDAQNRRVVYEATTYPAGDSTVTFVPNDTVFTNATGIATVQLRLRPGTLPDSVVVVAYLRRPNGTAVPEPPLTFVVEFRP